jgi:tyrosine-protein kinase Etk/Wzc
MSLMDLVNLLLRHRRLLAFTSVLAAMLLTTLTLLTPRTYTASASLLPQSNQGGAASRLSGLAAQFGVAVPGGDPSQSPAFYSALLDSREILQPLVQSRFRFRAGADSMSGTLIDLLEVEEETPGARTELAIEELRERWSVALDRQTGLVQVRVRTEWPELSYQVVERALALVNDFNIRRRQSQAQTEREFTSQQLERARRDLRQAENNLQSFLQRNRLFQSDPQLVFEHDRLRRTVTMRQDVYTTLAQAYEQANLDAVRDTPPMTVVERPQVPARPNKRGAVARLILGLVLGLVLGIVIAVVREFFARANVATRSAREFAELRRAALDDLRFWRSRRGGA